jgi:hypothetical protein
MEQLLLQKETLEEQDIAALRAQIASSAAIAAGSNTPVPAIAGA